MRWIKDESFIRGSIPMTKFEARIMIIAMLEIEAGDILLDIGAGTGSVSVEASLQGAEVYSIEKEPEGIQLIAQNSEKFSAGIGIIEGKAPTAIQKVPEYNKVFIGGSGGRLAEIVQAVSNGLESGGIIVGSFIKLDNLVEFQSSLKSNGFREIETRLIQCSRVEGRAELLKAQNPIFIVRGRKA